MRGRYRLRDGDIILTKSNSIDVLGRSALFMQPSGDARTYVASNFLERVRVERDRCEPRFLWYWLHSADAREYFRRHASGTSSSLQNLNASKLGALTVPLPDPALQARCIAVLDRALDTIDQAQSLRWQTAITMTSLRDRAVNFVFQ
jgi:type I restriction enzyme, S subunit